MDLVRLAALIAGGAAIGWALRIPSGELIGAMVATALYNLTTDSQLQLPTPVFTVALALIGGHVGSRMTRETLESLRAAGIGALAVLVVLLVVGLGLAYGLQAFGGIELRTALFATSPGAMSAVTGMSASAGADAVLVASFHVVRIFLVTASLPLLLQLAK